VAVDPAFRFPQGFKLDLADLRVLLPKLGWVCYRNSREVLGTVRNVTVSNRNGKRFVSIQIVREIEPRIAPGDAVGIDMGMVRFATLSDGTVCPPVERLQALRRRSQQSAAGYEPQEKAFAQPEEG
jgi:putative transposase